ncbi:noelin-3-like [Lingula anatina]|uniref:Noelin-3-like n=1 Tax=Lingula anatina TaxID=7574 RepID=A0A1S3HV28_LINAN|nr:noelin-3-like [Lingula anatina]|eukprot:XP_013389401.1 noelin-3-like [Lingula anatina]
MSGTTCPPGGSIRIENTSMAFQYSPAKGNYPSWMEDSQPTNPSGADRVWLFKGYENKVITVYETVEDMTRGIQSASITLPYKWAGTGHVVNKGGLFFQRSKTQNIVKYDIQKRNITAENHLKYVDSDNTCTYQWGGYATTDFAVDEYGLWLVYGNRSNNCNLVIAKINPDTLNVENSWATTIGSRSVGNTFMKCGVLYATDSYSETSTYIRYTYDTNTGKQETLPLNRIPFNQPGTYNTMLDYNPHDGLLYYADDYHGYLATFPIVKSV